MASPTRIAERSPRAKTITIITRTIAAITLASRSESSVRTSSD